MNDAKLIELAEDVAGLQGGMASIEDEPDSLTVKQLSNGLAEFIAYLEEQEQFLARSWAAKT